MKIFEETKYCIVNEYGGYLRRKGENYFDFVENFNEDCVFSFSVAEILIESRKCCALKFVKVLYETFDLEPPKPPHHQRHESL